MITPPKPVRIKLNDYVIKTKLIIGEVRNRYKVGNSIDQPFDSYYFTIQNFKGITTCGGIKTRKELFKKLAEEFR